MRSETVSDQKLFVAVSISRRMGLIETFVTVAVFVGAGYLYLRWYWIDDGWLNSELFR